MVVVVVTKILFAERETTDDEAGRVRWWGGNTIEK
jgi:hypothetical protein